MLTEAQESVIERIPVEGSLTFMNKGRPEQARQKDIDEALAEIFDGKNPPAVKRARIMSGPPGSGKTQIAQEWLRDQPAAKRQGIIFAGYNEGGAEQFYAPFQDEISGLEDHFYDKRLAVANKHRPVTQNIQNQILKRGLREEFSLLIDITAAYRGAGFLIDALRDVGYDDIELVGVYASFHVASGRALDRTRPTDPFDIVDKRTGSLGYLKTHADKCRRMEFFSNSFNIVSPQLIFTREGQNAPLIWDTDGLERVCNDLCKSVDEVREFLLKNKKYSSQKDKIDKEIDKMMSDYSAATKVALKTMQEVKETGIVQPVDHPMFIKR